MNQNHLNDLKGIAEWLLTLLDEIESDREQVTESGVSPQVRRIREKEIRDKERTDVAEIRQKTRERLSKLR